MPDRELVTEHQTDVILTGTINIAPDHFLEQSTDFFEYPEEFSIELVSTENGFTYRIEIIDVRRAEMQSDGKINVTFQKPGYDASTTSTEEIPRGFSITTIAT